jgi:hypothetical protein
VYAQGIPRRGDPNAVRLDLYYLLLDRFPETSTSNSRGAILLTATHRVTSRVASGDAVTQAPGSVRHTFTGMAGARFSRCG